MNEQLSLKQNLCLTLDQKMVRPKKAAIDLKTRKFVIEEWLAVSSS